MTPNGWGCFLIQAISIYYCMTSFFITDCFFWIFHSKFGETHVCFFFSVSSIQANGKSLFVSGRLFMICGSPRLFVLWSFRDHSTKQRSSFMHLPASLSTRLLITPQWKKWVIRIGMGPLLTDRKTRGRARWMEVYYGMIEDIRIKDVLQMRPHLQSPKTCHIIILEYC